MQLANDMEELME